ncbi:MAG TPA: thiamine pyrophosphate-binding protein [Bryobacteraceae bacterium]|jgi:acetolactate synthase-1/2/3 large subunit|nr:thiamine pyrophosphate-binding protein [Bryobacteraceae bacterium]
MPTHADALAGVLAERGVEYVFGLPGGEVVAFIDACRRAGLQFLLTGHEASAAWMAQVVGQITGVPGVCAATLGPGATNLVTGIANAFLDRAPVLAVTAQIPAAAYPTMTHQRLALNEMFAPITKRSVAIGDGDTAQIARDAMNLAAAPRPGPVHLSLANDVAIRECSSTRAAIPAEPLRTPPIDATLSRITASQRPLILIGLGATPACAPAIRALVDNLGAPFLVTPKAKGIVSEDHPLFVGVASGMAIDRDIVETIRTADVVLAIGFDPVECDKDWFATTNMISIDSATMAEGAYHPLEAIGAIDQLVAALTPSLTPKPWPADLLAARRRAIQRQPRESSTALSPLRVIEELRSIFPRDGILTCDVGSHKLMLGQFWRAYEPGTFFMSNGLSVMGFGLPAAIAAQLVHRDRPVMAIVGDGGMLMMLHDLVLLRQLGLPVIVIVLSDGSLSLIRVSAERRGFPAYGVDFQPPDFAAAAQAFGITGQRASTIAALRTAVETALTQRTSIVIDVPIDYREYYDLV